MAGRQRRSHRTITMKFTFLAVLFSGLLFGQVQSGIPAPSVNAPATARTPNQGDDITHGYLMPGQIEYANITGTGSSLTTALTCTVAAPPSGTTATCTPHVQGGALQSVTFPNPGSGYNAGGATITFSGSGSLPAATAIPRGANENSVNIVWNLPPGTPNGQEYEMLRNTAGVASWQSQGKPPLPCDVVTCLAAYGIKKLKSSYSGNAFDLLYPYGGSNTKTIGYASDGTLDMVAFSATGGTASIATWYDQSGNGYNATQGTAINQPSLTNLVLIDGLPAVFPLSAALNSAGNAQWLVIPTGLATTQQNYNMSGVIKFTDNYENTAIGQVGQSTGTNTAWFTNATTGLNQTGCSTTAYPQPGVVTFVMGGTSLGQQDSLQNDITTDGYQCYTGGAAGAQTGGIIGPTSSSLQGNQYAAFIVTGSLTAAQTQALNNSLSYWFHVPSQGTDLLFFAGDSITAGSQSSLGQSYPQQIDQLLQTTGRSIKIMDGGQPGILASTYCAASPFPPTSLYRATNTTNTLSILLGTNDIGTAPNAASVYTSLTQCIQRAQSVGYKVIINTILPSTEFSSGTPLTTWTNLNSLIVANAAGADYVCNLQSDPSMGPAGVWSNAALYADGLHPTSLGYSYIAQFVRGCYAKLTGY